MSKQDFIDLRRRVDKLEERTEKIKKIGKYFGYVFLIAVIFCGFLFLFTNYYEAMEEFFFRVGLGFCTFFITFLLLTVLFEEMKNEDVVGTLVLSISLGFLVAILSKLFQAHMESVA